MNYFLQTMHSGMAARRLLYQCARRSLIFAAACALVIRSGNAQTKPRVQLPIARLTDITASRTEPAEPFVNAEWKARGVAGLRLIVRSANQPSENYGYSEFVLVTEANDTVRAESGTPRQAIMDAVPAGTYRLIVSRTFDRSIRTLIHVKAGCRYEVEAYLAPNFLGISQFDTPMNARITVTECALQHRRVE